MNTIDLNNRTAIVTGGARGIGFAAAQKMLASGAAVALWDVDADALTAAVAALKGGRVHAARVEVTAEQVHKTISAPLREIQAVLAGVRTAFEFLGGRRRPRGPVDRSTQDEEMFI